MKRHPPATFVMLAILTLAGCDQRTGSAAQHDPRAQSLPTTRMSIGSQQFDIEVAITDSQQATGLMFRPSMPADHGMIFVFEDESPQSFWMKNTQIPLDIIYLDRAGKIVAIKGMKPFDLTGVDSGRPAKFAIELNAGAASKAGLKVGDAIPIPALSNGAPPSTAPAGGTGNPSTMPAISR